jgi:PAS domain S-box-containing protein
VAAAVAITAARMRARRSPIEPPTRLAGQLLDALGPLLMFPAIHFLRCADGNYFSNYGGLVVLPIAWLAVYGTLAQVAAGVVGCALTLMLPFLVVGAPQYPPRYWVGEAMIVLLAAVIGPIINQLVVGRRSISRTLVRREADFRAAFENAPIGMALTAVVGERAGYFLRVNQALCTMFGRSAEDLISHPLADLTHPDDVELTSRQIGMAAEADRGRYEKRFVHASGRSFWASVSYSLVRDATGAPLHLVSQIEDIDARRESERALLEALETDKTATERMRELERMRTDIASAVSHELRTPLTSASGYLELVLEGDAGPLTPEQRSMLDISFRSLNRMNALVRDILSSASLESQPVPGPQSEADLGRVVENAVSTVTLQIAGRGQDLHVVNDLHGVVLSADAGRLERVLVNLLVNASKFTDGDGRITVTARREISDDSDCAVIKVADTGIGIAPEDLGRIFQRFYRGDATGVGAVVEGSGLGLAIVQAITEQAGGTVSVDSTLGQGSTFTVAFPLDGRAGTGSER